jgi:uncharacterized protein
MFMTIPPRLKKPLYIFSGILSVALAYAGIIIPGLPGIPFILLAAYFFTNSSPRLYKWMLSRPLLSKLLKKSREGKKKVFKWLMVSQCWFSVAVIEFTLAHSLTAKVLTALGGVVLTVLVLVFMKDKKELNAKVSGSSEKTGEKHTVPRDVQST